MDSKCRVRFAPSPTGFLHVGGARTALFNWLFARAGGGTFLLRIEDTDTERSEARFTEDILASLKWLGLEPDEPPVFQSQRFHRYRELASRLVSEKKAYACDCSSEKLDAIREQCAKAKKPFRYPGFCREKNLPLGPNTVVRLKMPTVGSVEFNDLVRGHISFQNADFDDWVMMRANETPTYNFCVVVDDADQGVTHVLRGEDHINNTPKQIQCYHALGLKLPEFGHFPMILGTDKAKLSKRHGAASTLEYRAMGYLPDAMINFLVRLGWSHGDQEIFTREELCQYFSLRNVGKAGAVFNPEKLNWVSGQIFTLVKPEVLYDYLKQYFNEPLSFLWTVPRNIGVKGVEIIQGKVKTILELIPQLECLFGSDPEYAVGSGSAENLKAFRSVLPSVLPTLEKSSFSHDELQNELKAKATDLGVKFPTIAQGLRFAVTGGKVSPGLLEMLELQGKERVVRRVKNCIAFLEGVG